MIRPSLARVLDATGTLTPVPQTEDPRPALTV